mmetsp:Transcript_95636/g.274569  ORF Transcript_95636/g.274569 Transcript_95636/m.274569 type:complete len:202 (+) Transcript_95636:485-1090(+)
MQKAHELVLFARGALLGYLGVGWPSSQSSEATMQGHLLLRLHDLLVLAVSGDGRVHYRDLLLTGVQIRKHERHAPGLRLQHLWADASHIDGAIQRRNAATLKAVAILLELPAEGPGRGGESFELPDPRVFNWKVLVRIPRRSSEALKASITLEALPGRVVQRCVHLVREFHVFLTSLQHFHAALPLGGDDLCTRHLHGHVA